MLLESLFFQIGAVIVIAAAVSYIAHLLRQPMIIAYIIAGILVSPGILAITKSEEYFHAMSEIGVAFLLFTVGLGLNWRSIKEVGTISFATGIAQVIFTTMAGFIVGIWAGLDPITSIFLAIAFTFSSTIVIVKLLFDKEEADTLYGKISIGVLLIQDVVAMVVLLVLDAFQNGGSLMQILTFSLIKAVIALFLIWFLSVNVVPRLVGFAARSQELLLVFSIGWCFLIAGVLVFFGFGVEIGALIAGVTLSGTLYEKEIMARIRPLRDFFLVIFFIVLGTQLDFSTVAEVWFPAIVFSLFVLIGNPLIIMLVMRSLKYHPQTSFQTGTALAQISEFSFIVLAAGVAMGLLKPNVITLATFVGLITIAISAYFIKYNETLYYKIGSFLGVMEKDRRRHEKLAKKSAAPVIFLFGYHRMGRVLLDEVRAHGKNFQIVDFDPQVIEYLNEEDIPTVYGDIGDDEFLSEARVHKAKLIISTVPSLVTSLRLLSFLRSKKYKGNVIVTVKSPAEAHECYELGATYVIIPSVLGAEKFREMLKNTGTDGRKWKKYREKEEKLVARTFPDFM